MPNPTLRSGGIEQDRIYQDLGFTGMTKVSTTNPRTAYYPGGANGPQKETAPLVNDVDPSADSDKMPFPAGTNLLIPGGGA